ncbi:MAG: hypothetical protein ACM37W_08445 [Actinomycetota bacterium]
MKAAATGWNGAEFACGCLRVVLFSRGSRRVLRAGSTVTLRDETGRAIAFG